MTNRQILAACSIPSLILMLSVCIVRAVGAPQTRPSTARSHQRPDFAKAALDRKTGRLILPMSQALEELLGRPELAPALRQTRLDAPTTAPARAHAQPPTPQDIVLWMERNAREIIEQRSTFEAHLAAGKIDQALMREMVLWHREMLRDWKTTWPPITLRLLELADQGKLNVRELELALRILDYNGANLSSSVLPKWGLQKRAVLPI